MIPTKIVFIGAGSASFGLNTLSALMRSRKLGHSQLELVDSNQQVLDRMMGLAERLKREWRSELRVSAHRNHQTALEQADFVILSIEVSPREDLWRSDFEIPLKYSVRQPYAENGGPGGFAHAARNIGPVMEVVRDMEAICPQALLINFTNPMIRICDAVNQYSRIKVVGLCHQILAGCALVGLALAKDLGFHVPAGITGSSADPKQQLLRREVADQARKRLEIQAAGINHFTWMISIHDRQTGEDLYPLFTRRWAELPTEFEPLTRKVFEAFGLFPIPGDEHLCEYLPWVSDPTTQPWEKYSIYLYDWDTWAAMRQKGYRDIESMVSGESGVESLVDSDSEGALEVIENIAGSGCHFHLAFNLPNRGQIINLPPGAITETPGVVTRYGIQALNIGQLPEPIAELCRRELSVVRLCVDATMEGSRQKALQCLLLDPVIRDMDVAQKILDDYLTTYRDYLPQFWS